jgi:hypothetical protein
MVATTNFPPSKQYVDCSWSIDRLVDAKKTMVRRGYFVCVWIVMSSDKII